MMRNMFAKYSGRGTREFSTSLSSSSIFKRVWDKQSTSGLVFAFAGGFFGWSFINLLKRRALCKKIERMLDEHAKYSEEVWDRVYRYHMGDYDDPELDALNNISRIMNMPRPNSGI